MDDMKLFVWEPIGLSGLICILARNLGEALEVGRRELLKHQFECLHGEPVIYDEPAIVTYWSSD